MIAVDTNVVLRIVLDDDHAQVAVIRALMQQDSLFVSLSVLLETGWVLQSRYRFSRAEVAEALMLIIKLEGIAVARLALAGWAIERYRAGADLADVVHLVSAAKVGGFATFDRHLARDAGDKTPIMIETLR